MPKRKLIYRTLRIAGAVLVGGILILSIWQPVLPSYLIIKQMVGAIDIQNISMAQPAVIRFELGGKGGGVYSIVAENNTVQLIKGKTRQTDLIVFMEAAAFNDLVFLMASGKAGETQVLRLVLSNILSFAGDMGVFETLFKPQESSE